jgi:hypothetical protein
MVITLYKVNLRKKSTRRRINRLLAAGYTLRILKLAGSESSRFDRR